MPPHRVDLSPEGVKRLLEDLDEADYLLIDVRQPHEYADAHLPGALLMPLMEVEAKLFDLPPDRAVVFYCSSGSRSKMAAMLAEEAEIGDQPIYHLAGGTLAWDGMTVSDFPAVQTFGEDERPEALMARAMDLEKGALRFYREMADRHPEDVFTPVLRQLEQAEEAHARLVHRFLARKAPDTPDFDTVFADLRGEVLEGGMALSDAVQRLGRQATRRCLATLEFALEIECSAYDLYRHMADTASDASARDVFLAIAQAEKGHMKQLARAIADCGDAP